MGLPKTHRLQHRRDFRRVYQHGKTRHSRHLKLKVARAIKPEPLGSSSPSHLLPTRIGIAISRKVSKKAVIRNRIKRSIKAAFRQLLPDILPGWNIVLIVKPEAIGCEYEHFLRELKQLLKKAEVWNGH